MPFTSGTTFDPMRRAWREHTAYVRSYRLAGGERRGRDVAFREVKISLSIAKTAVGWKGHVPSGVMGCRQRV